MAETCALLLLQDYKTFQIIISFYCWTALVIYIGNSNPFKTWRLWKLELFNECFICLILYHLLCCADFVQDMRTLTKVGWSMVVTILINFIVNTGLVFTAAGKESF